MELEEKYSEIESENSLLWEKVHSAEDQLEWKVHEMSENIKTREKILDHKNLEIEDLKAQIISKDEEIQELMSWKNEFWDELEIK